MGSPPPEIPVRDQPPGNTSDARQRLLEQTLGAQYEVLRQLGEGGVGVVYLARERLLERLVAIKVLRPDYVSAEGRERFVREARTAAKLMHPNIVPLYSFGEAGDTLFYIMGYVEGESLETTLTRLGRLDSNEARRILVEVADALDYAHRNGVVHRDVKPDNILLQSDTRRALLTDFGIAKVQATQITLTQTGHIVGTPLYMSPEQAAGDSVVDGRSDLYSLGVIGYRMVAGRLPIEGTSAQDVMRRHVMQDPEPLGTIAAEAPSDLTWAIMRCLDKDPTRRWPTVGAFRQTLESGDEASSDLPEPLEHLSGRAAVIVPTVWALSMIAAVAFVSAQGMSLGIVAASFAVIMLASAVPSYVTAHRFGLSANRIWQLLGTPPERWSGWWPRALRRGGDVWDQLPNSVRRVRTARTGLVAFLVGLALPIVASLAMTGAARPSLLNVAWALGIASLVSAAALYAALRAAAIRELSSKGVQLRAVRRWLSEPTWGSPFWRRSETTPVLLEPRRPTKLGVDSPAQDRYSIITPTQSSPLPQVMFDHVDPRSPTPLYAQIASRLRVAIASGELRSGDGLPSVRQLAGQLRINPATVVQAYRELEVEGLVSTRHGAGTFVQEVAADRRHRDREKEARRLVRDVLAQGASMGINAGELRAAMDQELKSSGVRRGDGK